MTYTAYVMDKSDREIMTITRDDFTSKKEFTEALRQNGFAVKFVSTPEKFNADLEKYCEKKDRINRIKKFVRDEMKKAEQRATETTTENQEEKTMKETKTRFFYMSDIDSTMCVEISTKKDMLDLINETIRNNYTCEEAIFDILYKDGTEIRIDETNRKYKKTGIVSIVNDNGTTVQVYGNFEINENGVVYPAFETHIDDHLFEVTSWDYKTPTEEEIDEYISYEIENDVEEQNEETAEPKKQYDVFYTNQSLPSLAIYNHKPDRWKYDIPPILAMETEKSLYFCPAYYNVDDVVKFLKRNAARSENK